MMSDNQEFKGALLAQAVQDFQQARRKADLQEIFRRLTGKTTELLSYEEVRQKLHARESGKKNLTEIPLDKIVGSVGRYTDFTRDFLPLQDSAKNRWVGVMVETSSLTGLPPIEVYKIGEVYFVLDGNHRVSVARQLDATHIEAYVTELKTKVAIDGGTQPDDLIVKQEQTEFLEATNLYQSRPGSDLSITAPGKYPILLEHIDVHRYFIGEEQQRYVSFEDAAASWYDNVYVPIVNLIRERGIMLHFPGRTETDLYIWLSAHRAWLSQRLGREIESSLAIDDLEIQHGESTNSLLSKSTKNLLNTLTFDTIEGGPPTGEWRTTRVDPREDHRLFPDVLVSISGLETGWVALDQAIALAHREGSRVHGLHIVQDKDNLDPGQIDEIEAVFNQRCVESNVEGKLIVEEGTVARTICDHARFTDIVISRLMYPPGDQVISRLSSGYRSMIQKCPRPLLSVSTKKSQLSSAVLAYDGSPKAQEALYIAAYMVFNWNIPVTVLSVADGKLDTEEVINRAKKYFKHKSAARYEIREGSVAEEVLNLVDEIKADVILCGGYNKVPIVEVVFGSSVDALLREAEVPILICR